MDKIPSKIFVNKSSRLIVGEVANTLRAQGNITSTGDKIDSSANSPIVDGVYGIIPHMSVGIMDYSDLYNATQDFNEDPSGTNNNSEHPWNSIGAVSLDAIFCPYTTMADSGRAGPWLPRFTEAASGVSGPSSKTLNPFNPFNNLSGISPTGHLVNSDPWTSGGHNISMALNYNPYDSGVDGSGGFVGISGTYPGGTGSPVENNFEKDHFVRHTVETEGIRAVGLKSPLVLTGWGYSTDGAPVPSGTGVINGVSGIHPEAMWNPATWKSGPVDLRWDEARGVWTGGSTTEIIKFTVTNTNGSLGYNATACDYVLGTVTDIGCNTTVNEVGDTGVKIFDDDLCFFNLPLYLLIGMKGTAERFVNPYFGNLDTSDCVQQGAEEGRCRWVVTGLCCNEEIVVP